MDPECKVTLNLGENEMNIDIIEDNILFGYFYIKEHVKVVVYLDLLLTILIIHKEFYIWI